MLLYLLLYLCCLFYYFSQKQRPSTGFYVFLAFGIGIAGFRDMIGGYDIYVYSDVFEHDLKPVIRRNIFEPGFMAYFWLLKQLSEAREWMIFVSAVLVLGLHTYAIRRLSPLFYISFFIYFAKFYLMSFVYIRQGLAMAGVYLAYVFLSQNKRRWAWLLVLGSCFIHKSAIIVLPFLFIAFRKFTWLQSLLIAAAALLVSLSPLGDFLLGAAVEQVDSAKLAVYADKSGGVNIFYLIEGLLVLILFAIFRFRLYANQRYRLFANGLFFYGLIIILSLTNATFVRFAWYFFIFVVLALPAIMFQIKDLKTRQLFRLGVFIYYNAVFFRLLLVYDGGDFMPYKSIFQDFDRNGRWEFMEYRYD